MRISDWSSDVCSSDLRKKYSALPGDNLAVILANEARALRDQENAAGWAVEDILRDLRADLTRQVGAYARDERGWNNSACLQGEGGARCYDRLAALNRRPTTARHEFSPRRGDRRLLRRSFGGDRKSTRLNSSNSCATRMPHS